MYEIQQAKVYRCSDGKRFFTKRAALRREIMIKLKEKHADKIDDDGFHPDDWNYMLNVAKRYTSMYMYRKKL